MICNDRRSSMIYIMSFDHRWSLMICVLCQNDQIYPVQLYLYNCTVHTCMLTFFAPHAWLRLWHPASVGGYEQSGKSHIPQDALSTPCVGIIARGNRKFCCCCLVSVWNSLLGTILQAPKGYITIVIITSFD